MSAPGSPGRRLEWVEGPVEQIVTKAVELVGTVPGASSFELKYDAADRVLGEDEEPRRARGVRWGVDEGPRPLLADDVRERIARERAEGRSLRAIADGLTADGIPTARGGKWAPQTVATILRSPSLNATA